MRLQRDEGKARCCWVFSKEDEEEGVGNSGNIAGRKTHGVEEDGVRYRDLLGF